MNHAHDAERAVAIAEGLVNSHLPSGEHVDVDSPGALARLLQAYGVTIDRAPTDRDVEEVEAVRERLRAVFEAHSVDEAAGVLNRVLEEAGARPRLAWDDALGWRVDHVPAPASLSRRLAAATAMGLASVVAKDGIDRLRVCAWETCRDVFVDRSRNRSRRFCSPEVCGNRAAVAAWRARQRAGTSDQG